STESDFSARVDLCPPVWLGFWPSLYSSVLSVTLLSVQRYLQVLYPQRWAKLGRKGQKGLIFGIWISSGALASYALYYRNVRKNKNGLLQCFQDYRNDQEKLLVLLHVVLLPSTSSTDKSTDKIGYVSNSVTGALFFINSCVNPFLYAFSARALRCKRKQHSDQPQQYQDETE
ncbi:hypothetical protein M9458_011791, partial [Cirrhinus mrigala]